MTHHCVGLAEGVSVARGRGPPHPTTLVTRDDVRGFGPPESRREILLIDSPLHRGTWITASKLARERDKYQCNEQC